MDVINNRRSIRRYRDVKVEKEKIDKVLRAAMQAPSAYNQQAWEFIVVEKEGDLKKLSDMSKYSKLIEKSPLTIIVLGNKKNMLVEECWQQDLGAATQNILLEAVNQGLGAVWMAVTPFEDRMEFIRSMFNLPEYIIPYSAVSLGYSEDENKFIDRFNPDKVHYGKW